MELKKVLIIAYYWPPAGGPGVQRWLKFVKYLPEYNIKPIVFCPDNPHYPILDHSLIDEIPDGIDVLKQPIKEPYKAAGFLSKKKSKTISSGIISKANKQSLIEKILLFIRGNFFIPDARKNWVNPSTKYLLTYLKQHPDISTIITTGPPHSVHLIGDNLKKANDNIKWIADFRDPWTTIGYHKSLKLLPFASKKHNILESLVLNNADQLIVTSNNTKNEFELKTQTPISVITNGYDYQEAIDFTKDKSFSLAHIGSLLSERNPIILWEVLSDILNENIAFSEAFELHLIGVVSNDVIKSIHSFGLSKYLKTTGYVSHKEAITYQRKSQLLLLIEINSEETKAIIPGKLFEYLVSETPILAIGPEDSDIQGIIKSTNTGTYFNYNSKEALKTQLLEYFQAYKENQLKVNAIGLNKYSRKNLTQQLSELL